MCLSNVVTESLFDIYIFYVLQDHAGHIFGVDSSPMIEKLEQYNGILKVSLLVFTYIFCSN